MTNQLKEVKKEHKLKYFDIRRISNFLTTSMFDSTKCSVWKTYKDDPISVKSNIHINFYFNKKKMSLHRLLYTNFVDILDDNEYLKFTCLSKGKCCNINHMKKFKYNEKSNSLENSIKLKKINSTENITDLDTGQDTNNTKPLIINFD